MYKIVEKYTNIKKKAIKKRSRQRDIVDARFIFCALAKKEGYNFSEIGRELDKTPSAIHNAIKKVNDVKELNNLFNKIIK